MVKLAEYNLGFAPQYLILNIKVNDYKIDSIEKYSFVSVDQTSFITVKIKADEKMEGADPVELSIDHVIDKNIVIASVESDNYKYTLDSMSTEFLDNQGLKVNLVLNKEKTSYCENINKVDPFLMFYRKFLPYSRYAIYGSYKDELYYLGEIERVTYDTSLKKYKLYSSRGVVIYYDKLPLIKPSKVDVAGTQYTNPPTLVWIIDTQDLQDLLFLDTVRPKEIKINDNRYDSFADWVSDFTQGNFNIKTLSIEVRSINKRIVIDFDTYSTLDFKEFIQYINYDIIKTFKIPFKQVYFKLGDQFTLTRIIITYDDDKYIQIDGNFVYKTTG